MSLIPFILDLADELHEFSRCLANGIDINDFGFGLYTGTEQQQQQQHQQTSQQQQQQSSHQQQSPRRSRTSSFSSFWMPSKRHHPYNRIKSACCGKAVGDDGGVTINTEKDILPTGTPGKTASYSVVNKNGFQVSMNVKQFAPNELSVKTIDNCIVVEGRHDDKEDGHGVISRHFVRKYMLPKGYDPKDVLSTLSSDGILTVKAPPPPPPSAKTDEPNERIVEIQPTPGPTQMVPVVSAKEAQSKEQTTTKKLSSPATRAECQLPEKRQKLDLPQEQQESTEPQTPTTPLPTPTPTPTPPPSAPSASTANDDDDGDQCEKIEETAENEKRQLKQTQEDEGDGGGDENMETTTAAAAAAAAVAVAEDKAEKQLEKKEAMEIDETDKTVEEEILPETNGDTNNSTESAEANESATDEICTTSAKDDDVPAGTVSEADAKSSKSDNSKMEVDDEVAENNADNNMADEGDKAEAKTENEIETKTKTKTDGKAKTNVAETNNTNSTSTKTPTKSVKNDDSDNTGELPADAANSAATGKNNTNTTDAESASAAAEKTETTAVSPLTEATNTEIDNVALLKAAVATADASDIAAADEKSALLSEPMDGITTNDSAPAAVDTVECSLFAKSHLGNGNSNSAALVATEANKTPSLVSKF